MASLTLIILLGAYAYSLQLRYGLGVTGMNDHVSWGLYISNFTFLVGLAAAAMMLVLPAYVLGDVDFGRAVLMAEAVAVAALVMCLAFVVVDLGNPLGSWHLTPVIGYLNWPRSLLAWDVLVLNGYLAINLAIPAYILYSRYSGRAPDKRRYVPWMYIAVTAGQAVLEYCIARSPVPRLRIHGGPGVRDRASVVHPSNDRVPYFG
jgi:molybdopterin-containing oxidoreductase family membrane subunit